MLETGTKYFFICMCGEYAYIKLLNLDIQLKHIIFSIFFSLGFSATSYLFFLYAPALRIPFLASVFCIFLITLFKTPLKEAIISATLSFGISFFAFTISIAVLFPFVFLLGEHIGINDYFDAISLILAGPIQLLIVSSLFRINRIKSGVPLLLEQGISNSGVFVCACILLCASFFTVASNEIVYALFIFIIWGGVYLISWWKKKLQQYYLRKCEQNNLLALQQALDSKEKEILHLKRQNEELSKIVHKDNKLVPAMQIAVHDLLASSIEGKIIEKDRIFALDTQLNKLADERNSCLNIYENINKVLPKTGILSTDGVIKYCLGRAHHWGIHFDFSITGSVKYLVEHILEENDLNTLIADLVENALIATKDSVQRTVLLNIGIDNTNVYRIDVFDSGCLFESATMQEIGKIRTTTHQDTGGSGIGLMTTFELLKKYDASFQIDETLPGNRYKKCVSVIFNNTHGFKIISNRNDIVEALSDRTDIWT